MVIGRAVYSLVYAVLFVFSLIEQENFFATYILVLFTVGLPGVILQMLTIPGIVLTLEKKQEAESEP
mgnify:CR=1 FL=1